MHHTKLGGGQYVNHNGDWSGEIGFGEPILAVDCLDVVIEWLKGRTIEYLEADEFDGASALAELMGYLGHERGLLDRGRG